MGFCFLSYIPVSNHISVISQNMLSLRCNKECLGVQKNWNEWVAVLEKASEHTAQLLL